MIYVGIMNCDQNLKFSKNAFIEIEIELKNENSHISHDEEFLSILLLIALATHLLCLV